MHSEGIQRLKQRTELHLRTIFHWVVPFLLTGLNVLLISGVIIVKRIQNILHFLFRDVTGNPALKIVLYPNRGAMALLCCNIMRDFTGLIDEGGFFHYISKPLFSGFRVFNGQRLLTALPLRKKAGANP